MAYRYKTSDLGACHSAITRLYYSKWIWSRLSRFGDRWMKDEWFSPAQDSEKTYIKSGIEIRGCRVSSKMGCSWFPWEQNETIALVERHKKKVASSCHDVIPQL